MLDSVLIRFSFVGIANTFFGLAVIYACMWLADMGNVTANVIGYSAGLTLSFILNKKWTFKDKGNPLVAIARFSIVIAVAYTINLMVVLLLIHQLETFKYLAQAMGIIPYTAITYLGFRYWVFNNRTRQPDLPE